MSEYNQERKLFAWTRLTHALQRIDQQRKELPEVRDIAPHGETVKVWSFGVSLYLLLEQAMKFLLTKDSDMTSDEEGKVWRKKRYGHNINKIFEDLKDDYKKDLDKAYIEYASFIGFSIDKYPTLQSFLDGVANNDPIIQFRYILIEEKQFEWVEDYYIDMLLEVARNVVYLCHKNGTVRTICSRIYKLTSDVSHTYFVEGEGITSEMIKSWIKNEGGCMNAVSRLIRVPKIKMSEYDEPFTIYLKRTQDAIRKKFQEQDQDCSIFERKASMGCFLWDSINKKFRYYSERPAPLKDIESQMSDWKFRLCVDELGEPLELEFDWPDRVPIRDGQSFVLHLVNDNLQKAMKEIKSDSEGTLTLYKNGEEVLSPFRVTYMWSTQTSLTFKRGSKESKLIIEKDRVCQNCEGYGFCGECLGENEECNNGGLCGECNGYGKEGDYLLASKDRDKWY